MKKLMEPLIVKNSTVDGVGLFANAKISSGEKILTINAPIVTKKIKTPEESAQIMNWIGVGKDRWIVTDKTLFRFINHSCNPNTALNGRTLMSLRDIDSQEEVTIDYSMTDADPYWEMSCSCNDKNCRKKIRSIYTIPTAVFKKHFKYISKPFQRIFISNYIINKNEK
jgi:SET domain-containing protein